MAKQLKYAVTETRGGGMSTEDAFNMAEVQQIIADRVKAAKEHGYKSVNITIEFKK